MGSMSRGSGWAAVVYKLESLYHLLTLNKWHGSLAVQLSQFNHAVCPDE